MDILIPNPASKPTKSNGSRLEAETRLPQSVKRQFIDLEEGDQSPQKKTKTMLFETRHAQFWDPADMFLSNDSYPEPQTPSKRPLPHRPNPQTASFDSTPAAYLASEPRSILDGTSAHADVCQIVLAIGDHKSHCKSTLGNPNCAKHIISFKASPEEARQSIQTPFNDPRVITSPTPIFQNYPTPKPSRSPPVANPDQEPTATTPENRFNNAQRSPRTPIIPQPTNTEHQTPKSSSRKWAQATPNQWLEAQFEDPNGPQYLFGRLQYEHLVEYNRFMNEAFINQLVQNQLPSPKWKSQILTAAIIGEEWDQICGFPFDRSPVLGRRFSIKGNTLWDLEDDRRIVWETEKTRLELIRRSSELQMRHSDLRLEMGTITLHEWELTRELHEYNEMWDLSARIFVQSKLKSRLVDSSIEEAISEDSASTSDLEVFLV